MEISPPLTSFYEVLRQSKLILMKPPYNLLHATQSIFLPLLVECYGIDDFNGCVSLFVIH